MEIRRKRIHLWSPSIFECKGGIQVYSAFLLEALQSLELSSDYHVFLKHDTRLSSGLSDTQFHFTGTWNLSLRTPAFATQIISSGLWQRPNLVISTHLNFTVAAYWLKRLAGIPYWTVVHGVEAWNIQPSVQTALSQAERILAVSSYTRDRLLQEQNLDPAKISLLPNTFNAKQFKIAPKPAYLLERYNLRSEQPVILTVARLSEFEQYKGYDKIIEAMPQICQAIPNVHYLIVGKGNDRFRIEQMIAQFNLQDCVTLAGFVPDPMLGDHYNLCDVFAMPSKLEGFGIVYLEALASGKPTIGGNRDGAIDALCHGKLGALVNPDNVGDIAQTIIQILQRTYFNPLIYQPEALRQKVIEIYGFERFKQTLAQIFADSKIFN